MRLLRGLNENVYKAPSTGLVQSRSMFVIAAAIIIIAAVIIIIASTHLLPSLCGCVMDSGVCFSLNPPDLLLTGCVILSELLYPSVPQLSHA